MTNDDLKRFYPENSTPERNKDFVRYDKQGNIKVGIPVNPHDAASKQFVEEAIAGGGNPEALINFDVLSTTQPSSIVSTEDGFIVSYDNDGSILLPVSGTDDIIIDVDEDNKKIHFHLDANLQSKLSRMLVQPVSRPAETMYVGIDETGSQVLIPESNYVDINGLAFQHTDGTNLPTFDIATANTIYDSVIEGSKNQLKWSYGNIISYIEVNDVSFDGSTYSIHIIYHNTYAISYSWNSGSSSVTVNVKEFMFE